MNKTLRKSMLVAAMLTMGMGAWAQTDITERVLKNADLSVDPATADNGWTLLNNWRQDYQKATDTEHVNVVEFYAGWGSLEKTEYAMTQTVTLPAGDYRLAVNAFYRNGDPADGTNADMAYIFAGEKKQNVYPLTAGALDSYKSGGIGGSGDLQKASNAFYTGAFSNEFDFTVEAEGEIEIGFKGTFDVRRSWVILGPVKLYQYSLDDYLADYRVKVAEAQDLLKKSMGAEAKADLQAAIVDESTLTTGAQVAEAIKKLNEAIIAAKASIALHEKLTAAEEDVYNALDKYIDNGAPKSSMDELDEIAMAAEEAADTEIDSYIAKMYAKLGELCKQQTKAGSDMTRAIVNFDCNSAEGWTCEKPNGGNGPLPPNGAPNFEFWIASAANGAFDYSQKLEGMPNGKYVLKAQMHNSTNGEADAQVNGSCGLYAKSGETEVFTAVTEDGTELKDYATDEIEVADNTLTVGVKNKGTMGARWFVADNFSLTLTSEGTPTAISEVKAQPATAGTIYNLAGQRVEKAQKGLYIIDGKKVMK